MLKKVVKTCVLGLVLLLFMSFKVDAKAASKEIPLELDKPYDACAFTVTTESFGHYDVTVVSPRKDEYKGTIDGNNSTEVLIKDVISGKWKVRVEDAHNESSLVASNLDDADDGEIGKVKVSVRAIDVSSYTIDEKIKVAKDINGLKMYFKDDNLEVEWSDQSVGNVVVAVTDSQTSVEISKETVNGNSFECEIPELTKQVTVTIVPSTSSNIENAASQFTVDVANNPNATVKYEDKEYVNTETIPVLIEQKDRYAVELVVNGKVVEDIQAKDAGTYNYEIPVNEGENEVLTYIIDENGNMRSYSHTVIKDSESPVLNLEREYDGAKTYNEKVVFTGTVSGCNKLTINNSEVNVSGDGVWNYEYELHDGDNSVVFKATDHAGNETVYPATVTRLIKEKKNIPWIPIILATALIIAIDVFVIRKRNDPGNGQYNNMIDGIKEKIEKKKRIKTSEDRVVFHVPGWQKFIVELVVVAIVSALIFKLVLIPGTTVSNSMEPTIKTGDWGFSNGLAYVLKEPQRGDVIVFYSKELGKILTKRVIGLPGDTVSFYDGYVYINDGLIREEYIDEDVETNSAISDFIVPEGSYFVLGDNREYSYDSRFWSDPYVKRCDIKGKWMTALLHFDLGKEQPQTE